MTVLVLVGNDYWGRVALSRLEASTAQATLILDASSRTSRTLKLLWKRRVSLFDVLRLGLCEMRRSHMSTDQPSNYLEVRTNSELKCLVEETGIRSLLLFRAGLIIDAELLELPIDVLNIHAAKLPEFAGLMAIPRAIRAGSLKQQVTLHRVTGQVDQGPIEGVRHYEISPGMSVCQAENIAYEVAIDMLLDVVASRSRY